MNEFKGPEGNPNGGSGDAKDDDSGKWASQGNKTCFQNLNPKYIPLK